MGQLPVPHPIPLPPEKLARVQLDEWGIEWTQESAGLFYVTHPPLAAASSISDLEQFQWPEPQNIFHTPQTVADAAHRLRQDTDCAICLDLPDTVVHVSQNIRGYEQWLVDSVLDVPFFEALLDRIAEIYCAMVGPVLEAASDDIDLVIVCDDIGVQNGPLVSPVTYQRLIKPRHKRVFETIKNSSDAKLIFHSDGSMRWALPHLIDIGIDAFNPVQCSASDMDPAHLKQEFGNDVVFWGSIDTQKVLPFGTPEEVRAEVRRMINAFYHNGGFVIGSVHIIQKEVPPENVLAMAEAAHVYGGRSDGSQFRIQCQAD
jgi:uroporphyrinogen decarboxylase